MAGKKKKSTGVLPLIIIVVIAVILAVSASVASKLKIMYLQTLPEPWEIPQETFITKDFSVKMTVMSILQTLMTADLSTS